VFPEAAATACTSHRRRTWARCSYSSSPEEEGEDEEEDEVKGAEEALARTVSLRLTYSYTPKYKADDGMDPRIAGVNPAQREPRPYVRA